MTNQKYKAMIQASGGFTLKSRRVGNHPQPLAASDETALSKVWEKIMQPDLSSPDSAEPSDNKLEQNQKKTLKTI